MMVMQIIVAMVMKRSRDKDIRRKRMGSLSLMGLGERHLMPKG